MADSKKIYLVTNRSASRVCYAVPEIGVKSRDFQPGETKKITYAELEGLSYLPGGDVIIREYLQIKDPEVKEALVGETEPEYNMTAEDVKNLILNGSHDEWLDALDFAPEGVIDLMKTLSVELPLTDTRKMEAFQKKTGLNLKRMIEAKREEEEEAAMLAAKQAEAAERRVQPNTEPAPAENKSTTRRTSGSKYKVVSRPAE